MKKIFFIILITTLLSCDDTTDNNPFLPNVNVNFTVDLNLPQNSDLLIGGSVIYENRGVRGIVINYNGLTYSATDLACPHIELQSCSTMTVDGSFIVCPCDDEKFQIFDGASVNDLNTSARTYQVTKNGNLLRISS